MAVTYVTDCVGLRTFLDCVRFGITYVLGLRTFWDYVRFGITYVIPGSINRFVRNLSVRKNHEWHARLRDPPR